LLNEAVSKLSWC